MMLYYDWAPAEYVEALDSLNIAFTCIYAVEAGLKIWAYGFNRLIRLPRYF
jgi:hypothetical protein